MKILLIGNGAREHAIAKKLKENSETKLFTFASANNPGLSELSEDIKIVDLSPQPTSRCGDKKNNEEVIEYAKHIKPDLAWIGPEAPLAQGIVDALEKVNIACVGPLKNLAKIETSKSFTRNLLVENNIHAYPKFKVFKSINGIEEFVKTLDEFVIKPDGLTGGKGVRVQGDHFQNFEQALVYMKELIEKGDSFIIEEKLIGQEFSLMSFCDGKNLKHMPVVQDHKRAYIDDKGPNTGGMGSYSCANHSLPFLKNQDIEDAQKINEQTLKALFGYKGILYGGFIAVKNGIKLIEYNARFGDPEAMNVLPILKTDLTNISKAIISGQLNKIDVEFDNKATVCKYIAPEGYPDNPIKDKLIDISEVDQNKVELFYASVDSPPQPITGCGDKRDDGLYLKGSRAIGVVAKADSLEEAEKLVQGEIIKIKGPVFFREDIGTKELVEKRIKMMEGLRK